MLKKRIEQSEPKPWDSITASGTGVALIGRTNLCVQKYFTVKFVVPGAEHQIFFIYSGHNIEISGARVRFNRPFVHRPARIIVMIKSPFGTIYRTFGRNSNLVILSCDKDDRCIEFLLLSAIARGSQCVQCELSRGKYHDRYCNMWKKPTMNTEIVRPSSVYFAQKKPFAKTLGPTTSLVSRPQTGRKTPITYALFRIGYFMTSEY